MLCYAVCGVFMLPQLRGKAAAHLLQQPFIDVIDEVQKDDDLKQQPEPSHHTGKLPVPRH